MSGTVEIPELSSETAVVNDDNTLLPPLVPLPLPLPPSNRHLSLSLSPAELQDPPLPRTLPNHSRLQPPPLRARSLADHIEAAAALGGWGFWTSPWRFGWDYARNYAWRSDWETSREVYGAVGELNELLSRLGDCARLQNAQERVDWFCRNHRDVVGSAKTVFERLLGVFARSGPLRDAVESMRKEVVDGDFLRDCLEIGGNDLKGIIQVLKDLLLRLYSPSDHSKEL